jgi:hypothetical protein
MAAKVFGVELSEAFRKQKICEVNNVGDVSIK